MRFLPAIAAGWQASGIRASMNSGYVSPHTQVCMPPIEAPITSPRWVPRRPSLAGAKTKSAQDEVALGGASRRRARAGERREAEQGGGERLPERRDSGTHRVSSWGLAGDGRRADDGRRAVEIGAIIVPNRRAGAAS